MQNTIKNTATATADKAAKQSPRVLALQAHDAAGFTGTTYTGLSKPRNAGNTAAPNLNTSKAAKRDFASLTPRMLATLRELATAYGKAAFPLPGIDRGQAAIFLASGFFVAAGDAKAKLAFGPVKTTSDGKPLPFYHVPDTFLPGKPKA